MSEQPRRFRLLGQLRSISVIAQGHGIRINRQLIKEFGGKNWRKMKGFAVVETDYGWIGDAEIHWYEAHGVGKVRWKIKSQIH